MQEPNHPSIASTITLHLEHLPPFQALDGNGRTREPIARYLATLVHGLSLQPVHSVRLPSISDLADFFQTTAINVYDALRKLRDTGYDFQFGSLDCDVIMWRQTGGPDSVARQGRMGG